jgi:hypothetical protein
VKQIQLTVPGHQVFDGFYVAHVLSVVLLLTIVVCRSSGYLLGIFKLFIIQRKTGFKK